MQWPSRTLWNCSRRLNSSLSERVAKTVGLSSRDSRLLPETLQGRVYRPQISLNPEVAKAINNNIMALHLPNNLRRMAQQQYMKMNADEMYPVPRSSLETDSFIASFFLRDYGAAFQVLQEWRQRIGKEYTPSRVLEVGFGPATGMVALNDVMGPDFRPSVKDAVIFSGGIEMEKRAKIILSRQYNEIPTETLEKLGQLEDPDEEEKTDLLGEVMTKKIKIVTNLKDKLPQNKEYDLIILNHQLLTSRKKFPIEIDENIEKVLRLLAPGGHLIIVERGTPLGFETIARARQIMIRPERFPNEHGKIPRPWIRGSEDKSNAESSNYHLSILAPCPHHRKCPLQLGNPNYYDLKEGKRLKFCSFQKAIIRPEFSLQLKRGKLLALPWNLNDNNNNHPKQTIKSERKRHLELRGKGRPDGKGYETLSYSYLIVYRSFNDPETISHINKRRKEAQEKQIKLDIGSSGDGTINTWPRIINTPSKQKGHVTLDVCGASGELEKWIIPRSFSKEIYHDARKAQKGDLWGLDAKTTIKSLGTLNISKFAQLEKKRIRQLKKETKEKELNMSQRFNELNKSLQRDNDESLNQAETITELSQIYGHYYDENKKK